MRILQAADVIADPSILPSRNDYINAELKTYVRETANNGSPIMFMPTNVAANRFGEYVLQVFGILPDGSTACVCVKNISLYVDVSPKHDFETGAPPKITVESLKGKIQQAALTTRNRKPNFNNPIIIQQFSPRGFQEAPHDWLRYDFKTFHDRLNFLTLLGDFTDIETAHDDPGAQPEAYYKTAARKYLFSTGDWNTIFDYRLTTYDDSIPVHKRPIRTDYVFEVDVANYRCTPKEDWILPDEVSLRKLLTKSYSADYSMVASWDVETHMEGNSSSAPTTSDNFVIFNMCTTFAWYHASDPMLKVSCIHGKTSDKSTILDLSIECETQEQVYKCNFLVWQRMRFEYLIAFNGGNFDWDVYRHKLIEFHLVVDFIDAISRVLNTKIAMYRNDSITYETLESDLEKYCWSRESIKIDAENNHNLSYVLNVPGIIDLDVLPIMLKAYPRAEVPKLASLNFFLSKNGLSSKEDMPYKKMFRIYERSRDLANNVHTIRPILDCKVVGSDEHGDIYDLKIDPEILIDPTLDASFKWDGPRDLAGMNQIILTQPELLKNINWEKVRERNMDDMGKIADYCAIDCVRPHQLLCKRTVYSEYREIAELPRVSIHESYYRAGGMKVGNKLAMNAEHVFNIGWSSARSQIPSEDKDHYPGAHVEPPKTRLITDEPITGQDVNSLYPSLMNAYNLSPDRVVRTHARHDELVAKGYVLHQIGPFAYEKGLKKGDRDNRKMTGCGWVVRHNNSHLDGGKHIHTLVKKITHTDPQTKETQVHLDRDTLNSTEPPLPSGWTRSTAYIGEAGRAALPNETIGIFGHTVQELLTLRRPIKNEFVRLEKEIEKHELAGKHDTDIVQDAVEGSVTLAYLHFCVGKTQAKQIAIKLLANTIYGLSGDFRQFIYDVLVAAGITIAGQNTIKHAISFASARLQCETQYGDTDSMYIQMVKSFFTEVDTAYQDTITAADAQLAAKKCTARDYAKVKLRAKIRLWTEKVKITMKYMKHVSEALADEMVRFNGTNFIQFAYEEVLFPAAFLGKKKYCGAAHIETINFGITEDDVDEIVDEFMEPNGTIDRAALTKIIIRTCPKPFVKGLEIIKQGKTKVVCDLGDEIVKRSIHILNDTPMIDMVVQAIDNFYNVPRQPFDFSCLGRYKPEKRNATMHKFFDRMQTCIKNGMDPALYTAPVAGDKFRYVVVKKDQRWSTRGTKIDDKKGDWMEFLRVYEASQVDPRMTPMEIDKDYYMSGSFSGILARFISWYPQFAPDEKKMATYDLYDKDDYIAYDSECTKAAVDWIKTICARFSTKETAEERRRIGVEYRRKYKIASEMIYRFIREKYGNEILAILHNFEFGDNIYVQLEREKIAGRQMMENLPPYDVQIADIMYGVSMDRVKRMEQHREQMDYHHDVARMVIKRFAESIATHVELFRDGADVEFDFAITRDELEHMRKFLRSFYTCVDISNQKWRATHSKLFHDAHGRTTSQIR